MSRPSQNIHLHHQESDAESLSGVETATSEVFTATSSIITGSSSLIAGSTFPYRRVEPNTVTGNISDLQQSNPPENDITLTEHEISFHRESDVEMYSDVQSVQSGWQTDSDAASVWSYPPGSRFQGDDYRQSSFQADVAAEEERVRREYGLDDDTDPPRSSAPPDLLWGINTFPSSTKIADAPSDEGGSSIHTSRTPMPMDQVNLQALNTAHSSARVNGRSNKENNMSSMRSAPQQEESNTREGSGVATVTHPFELAYLQFSPENGGGNSTLSSGVDKLQASQRQQHAPLFHPGTAQQKSVARPPTTIVLDHSISRDFTPGPAPTTTARRRGGRFHHSDRLLLVAGILLLVSGVIIAGSLILAPRSEENSGTTNTESSITGGFAPTSTWPTFPPQVNVPTLFSTNAPFSISIPTIQQPTLQPTPIPVGAPIISTNINTMAPSLAPVMPTMTPTASPSLTHSEEETLVPTPLPTQWPEECGTDSATGTFLLQNGQPRTCQWLAFVGENSIDLWCQPERDAYWLCRETCRNCNPNPTIAPTITSQPSLRPTASPSSRLTVSPTTMPSLNPVSALTAAPSLSPVNAPNAASSLSPVNAPTAAPSLRPVNAPTAAPSLRPVSSSPTQTPTTQPTPQPTTSRPSPAPIPSPTNFPTSQPVVDVFREQILSAAPPSTAEALEDSTSPQYEALEWLRNDDFSSNLAPARLRQRFALASMAVSIGLDGSRRRRLQGASNWMSASDECTWTGIVCTFNDAVFTISLPESNLAGFLVAEFAMLAASVVYIDIRSNSISGTIPDAWGALSNLVNLVLAENDLWGSIPSSISGMTSLEGLYLNNNNLSGELPSSAISQMTNLETLTLHRNEISGSMDPICGLRLETFTVDCNEIEGSCYTICYPE